MTRPTWTEYWMKLAMVTRSRSHDPDTKHGAIIVGHDNVVLGMGYNGFPRGGGEEHYPDERPHKYRYMVHAELNAIIHCTRRPVGATIYVTGIPCPTCFGAIIQAGIRTVVMGPIKSAMIDNDDVRAVGLMAKVHNITLQHLECWPGE